MKPSKNSKRILKMNNTPYYTWSTHRTTSTLSFCSRGSHHRKTIGNPHCTTGFVQINKLWIPLRNNNLCIPLTPTNCESRSTTATCESPSTTATCTSPSQQQRVISPLKQQLVNPQTLFLAKSTTGTFIMASEISELMAVKMFMSRRECLKLGRNWTMLVIRMP